MVKKQNRIGLIIGLSFLMIFFISIVWSELKMKEYEIGCASFKGVYLSKSNTYYKIKFKVGNHWINTSRQGGSYNSKRANFLKHVKCIRIAYAKSDPTITRILDKELRAVGEWLWFLNEKDKKKYCW